MKNLRIISIFLFSLFILTAQGQVQTQPSRSWYGKLPATRPSGFYVNRDLFLDSITNKGYFHNGTKFYEDVITPRIYSKGSQGPAGPVGPQGPGATIQVGTTTTLPAGSTATVINTGTSTNAILNFGIPKGSDGVGGGSGGGLTAQQVMDLMPFIYVKSNGVDDTQVLQAAVDKANTTGQKVWGTGTLKVSNTVWMPTVFNQPITITGGFKIQIINQNTFTVFAAQKPTSVANAEGDYTRRWMEFSDFIIQGNGQKQTGFNVGPAEGHMSYRNIECNELALGWNNVFHMRSYDWYCSAINCIDGMRITSGANNEVPGGNGSNTSSNGYESYHFRYYAPTNGNIGIKVEDVSSVKLNAPTGEGHFFNIFIYWSCAAPTADGAQIYDMHGEMGSIIDPSKPQQPGIAYIYLKTGSNTHIIDKPKIKKGIMVAVELTVNAQGQSFGYPWIIISNISSGKGVADPSTYARAFKTVAGTTWTFDHCDDPFNVDANIPGMFQSGVTMKKDCRVGRAENSWCN